MDTVAFRLDPPEIRPMRRPTLAFRLLTLTLALFASVLPARSAAAQPGSGTADAITAKEINAFAERLGLTPTQRVALDPIHDAYKAEFDQLRTQLIDPFMARQREMNMGGPAVTRDAVAKMLEEQTRINSRVAQLDNRFFDQMAPLLSGPQQAVLPRVRLARERTRLLSNQMLMAFGGVPADLSAMFARTRVRMTPEQLMQVDEILVPYEQRLTRRIGDLSDLNSGMMLKMVDMMDEAGLLGMSQEEMMADPERMEAVMETVQQAFAEIGRQSGEKAAEIRDLNVATYRRLLTALPPRSGAALRAVFLQEGIPFWFGVGGSGPSEVWIEAMDVADLPAETRETIDAELLAAFSGENQLYDGVIDEVLKSMANATPMDFDMDAMNALQERVSEVTRTLAERQTEAETRVAALLGEDWRTRRTESTAEGSMVAGMPGGVGGFAGLAGVVEAVDFAEGSSAEIDEDRVAFDDLLPSRIGGRTLRGMVERIDITREDLPILETLHQDYREAFAALPSFTAVRDQWRARWSDQDGTAPSSAVDRIQSLNTARRTAFAEIAELEERFFDDLAATFGGTPERAAAVERERLVRRLARLKGPVQLRNWAVRGGTEAGRVDLAALVHGLSPMSKADRRAIAAPLEAYLNAAIPVAERMVELVMEMQVSEARWQDVTSSMAESGGNVTDAIQISQRYTEVMGTVSERVEAGRDELAAAAEAGVAGIGSVVSPEGRRALEKAWREAAVPRVYRDPLSVVGHFERALELENLSSDVRRELGNVLADYRAEWERLSAEMAEGLQGRRMNQMNWQQVDWVEVQEFQQRMSALASERADRSIRAANQLRVLLDEGQLARLGGLPNPEDAASGWADWMF